MLYLFRLLLLLINIDQETVLKWFGIEDLGNREILMKSNINITNLESSSNLFSDKSLLTLYDFRTILYASWESLKDGLTLTDIENCLFFILFVRFVILTTRYNLKTSFYITCIGLFAGYLWYRHLIDLISMYRSVLLKIPFLNNLGIDAVQLRSMQRQTVLTDVKLGENVSWYNPGQVLYYAFARGIIDVDQESGFEYYIDPISMAISNIKDPTNSNILPLYYRVYNKIVPKIYEICSKFWAQLSGVAAYAVITRIGKRYCPYLVRWHWTFLLIIGMIEQIFIYFIYRVYYFQSFVLIPQLTSNYTSPNLNLQISALNILIACVVLAHIGFIIFGLFHAIWGQYFYLPFFVENTELHTGPRPKDSIYSGGYTSWQDSEEREKHLNFSLLRFWYGWFGRGTQTGNQIKNPFKKFIKKFFKRFRK